MIITNDISFDYNDNFTSTPLLTAAEEVSLAETIRTGEAALETLNSGNKLTKKARYDLNSAVKAGKKAHEHFVLANTRLALDVAGRYRHRGMPFNDLVSAGLLGVIHALRKWDHTRGLRFSTYAVNWIKQYIQRSLANEAAIIRLPEHRITEINKIRAARHTWITAHQDEPTLEDISAVTGFPVAKIRELDDLSRSTLSLNATVGDEDNSELGDLLPDVTAEDPTLEIENAFMTRDIAAVLNSLAEQERTVLSLRFGMTDDGEKLTLEEVGRTLGVTRERVRQIEANAMAKLRHPRNAHLADYINN